jgi:EAL domain-containing protein (putative c-di-GMP-specific phosphodiesterase class I)
VSDAVPARDAVHRPGLHAFVVDDEAQVRAFVAKVFIAAGYIPHEFSRVAEVESALTLYRPEVIVLDLTLGQSDAIEMMRSLTASHYRGKTLLVSGHDEATLDEVRKIGERHGLTMLPPLRKPFRIAELKERLALPVASADDAARIPDLGNAIQNNWLELWYQPKIDLKSMAVCGAEALVRIRHPDRGVINPGGFLPPPGDELYRPLTDFVVRRALADWSTFAAWPSVGGEWAKKRLAINVPASILQGKEFVEGVRRHLPSHPLFPGLIVEITEDEAISDPDLAREIAIQLKLYNIHVSIDDFGAGHSSFARLKQLPFAELKLDRAFVFGCSSDREKLNTCKTVVELARRFRVTTVAEGVENAGDLTALIGLGYDVAQGYYFAKAMPGDDFIKMMVSAHA